MVPDQRHEEHDRGEEDPTKPEDERQDERGGKSEVLKKLLFCDNTKQADPHVVNNVGLNIRVFIMAAVPANSRLGLNIEDLDQRQAYIGLSRQHGNIKKGERLGPQLHTTS